jgi:hypothetical protein
MYDYPEHSGQKPVGILCMIIRGPVYADCCNAGYFRT